MIKDTLFEESKGKQTIEILVDNVWLPIMATDVRIFTKDNELVRVEEVRVRKL